MKIPRHNLKHFTMSSFYEIITGRSKKWIVLLLQGVSTAFIVYCLWIIAYIIVNDNIDYAVDVKPASDTTMQTLAQYDNKKIIARGMMIVPEPGIAVKLCGSPYSRYLSNFIECLFIIFIALQAFFICRNAASTKLSLEKIGIYLNRIGIAIIIFHFANTIMRNVMKKQVLAFTNNEFKLDEYYEPGRIWVGVIFIALAVAIRENAGLKKEQELTI